MKTILLAFTLAKEFNVPAVYDGAEQLLQREKHLFPTLCSIYPSWTGYATSRLLWACPAPKLCQLARHVAGASLLHCFGAFSAASISAHDGARQTCRRSL